MMPLTLECYVNTVGEGLHSHALDAENLQVENAVNVGEGVHGKNLPQFSCYTFSNCDNSDRGWYHHFNEQQPVRMPSSHCLVVVGQAFEQLAENRKSAAYL
jgi:hypothetical protein